MVLLIEEQKSTVTSGSYYSADEVIAILNLIKIDNSLPEDWKSKLSDSIHQMIIDNLEDNWLDYSNVDLSLNGNEIEVECVGYNSGTIERSVDFYIENYIDDILNVEDSND